MWSHRYDMPCFSFPWLWFCNKPFTYGITKQPLDISCQIVNLWNLFSVLFNGTKWYSHNYGWLPLFGCNHKSCMRGYSKHFSYGNTPLPAKKVTVPMMKTKNQKKKKKLILYLPVEWFMSSWASWGNTLKIFLCETRVSLLWYLVCSFIKALFYMKCLFRQIN